MISRAGELRTRWPAHNVPGVCPGESTDTLAEVDSDRVLSDARLLHGVALADGDRAVLHGLAVHGDAERRARLVLAAVAPPDRARLVVEAGDAARAQVLVDLHGPLGHAVLLHQRENTGLDRRQRRLDAQHHARLALD